MAYGVVPLAGAVSSIPQTLQACGAGMSLNPDDPQAFVNGILAYVKDPQRWKRESEAARRAASRYTYEAYLEQVKDLFADHWGIAL
jgi:glycosyltransferase involved in cell wall biosynthesis